MALLDAGQRQPVGVADNRHDQALVGADRNSDVVVVLVDDVLAVDLGVHRRDLLQRLDHRLDEEAHETELDAVLLLEGVLVLAAQRHHVSHVDFIECREHGGGVLRILQPASDGLPEPAHPDAFFALRRVARLPGFQASPPAAWRPALPASAPPLPLREQPASAPGRARRLW